MLRNIPKERVIARIRVENPWWETGSIDPFFANLKPRAYFDRFKALLADIRTGGIRRAPILMGPRRVGKTVLLFHLIDALLREGVQPRSIVYLSVEHPLFNGLDLDQLVELAQEAAPTDLKGAVFVFDEIQYLRDWELHLKKLVDQHRHTTWIASGSAAAALRMKGNESGAGRFSDFLLPPLAFHEYVSLLGADELPTDVDESNRLFIDYLNYGGYPELALSDTMRADPARYVRQDIIDKVLLRDLPSLYGISDVQELNALFTSLAFNTGNEISLDKLSKSANVAKNTVKRYLDYLEAAFLVKRVERIDRDGSRFERATTFKVYLTNPSIRAALFSPIDQDDEDMGNMVETAVFAQWFHLYEPHYARWKGGEVDLVLRTPDGKLRAVCEAKWSDRFASSPGELRGLLEFCKTNRRSSAAVTTRTVSKTMTVDGIELTFVPAARHCYLAGKQDRLFAP
jgi:predicted AAA+ superfamily ATPase